jgi:hypothetical protein
MHIRLTYVPGTGPEPAEVISSTRPGLPEKTIRLAWSGASNIRKGVKTPSPRYGAGTSMLLKRLNLVVDALDAAGVKTPPEVLQGIVRYEELTAASRGEVPSRDVGASLTLLEKQVAAGEVDPAEYADAIARLQNESTPDPGVYRAGLRASADRALGGAWKVLVESAEDLYAKTLAPAAEKILAKPSGSDVDRWDAIRDAIAALPLSTVVGAPAAVRYVEFPHRLSAWSIAEVSQANGRAVSGRPAAGGLTRFSVPREFHHLIPDALALPILAEHGADWGVSLTDGAGMSARIDAVLDVEKGKVPA